MNKLNKVLYVSLLMLTNLPILEVKAQQKQYIEPKQSAFYDAIILHYAKLRCRAYPIPQSENS